MRSRISSQAMTRAKRVAAELDADRTFRSVTIAEKITGRAAELLAKRGTPVDDAARARLRTAATKSVQQLTAKDRDEPAGNGQKPEGGATALPDGAAPETTAAAKDTMIWLSEAEIEAAAIKLAGCAPRLPTTSPAPAPPR